MYLIGESHIHDHYILSDGGTHSFKIIPEWVHFGRERGEWGGFHGIKTTVLGFLEAEPMNTIPELITEDVCPFFSDVYILIYFDDVLFGESAFFSGESGIFFFVVGIPLDVKESYFHVCSPRN